MKKSLDKKRSRRKKTSTAPTNPTCLKTDALEVCAGPDVDAARRSVQALAAEIGMDGPDQDMVGTATSELARNMVDYGGGGAVLIEVLRGERGLGLRVTFEDHGPGIEDVEKALEDGFSTGTGLGLGLPGAKRLVHEFQIDSRRGLGTRVVITRWVGP